MSQNISSRRQELLSRLKTTLAIVSQATGFDNERAAGDSRPTEQHPWNVSRDPRVKRQDTYHEGPGTSEPGSSSCSAAVTSTAAVTAASSSNMFQKFDEIQDEDEFLYGSNVSEGLGRQPASESSQNKRADEQQAVHLEHAAHRPVSEEDPRWTRAPVSTQSGYNDPPQTVSHDHRWTGSVESTRVGPISDQSQWMHTTSQRVDTHSWGAGTQSSTYSDVDERQSTVRGPPMASDNAQTLRYSDVDYRQSAAQGLPTAPASVGLQPESVASKLQGINVGMLEGILKLVASGTNTSASRPLPPQQQQQQQPSFDSRQAYGSGYPSQSVYNQPLQQHSYVSSGIGRDVPGGAAMFSQQSQLQRGTYDYVQPAPLQQHHASTDANPLLSQLPTSFQMTQTPGHRVTGLMEQAGGQSPAFRPVATSMDSQFVASQPADRFGMQLNVTASGPPDKPQTAMSSQYPVGYDVPGPAVAAQPEKTAVAEADKGAGGLQKSEVDKDTLSRLLNMIGCGSNVTLLMQELIKKDEHDKMKKQQTPAPQAPEQQDSSSVPPAAVPAQPSTTEHDTARATTTSVPPQTPPEPPSKTDSAECDEKPKAGLPPQPAKESETNEIKSTIPVLSSLSRLQKNYDSPDENGDKDSALAAKTGEKNASSASSQVVKDDDWERSTEEFLRQLQSKPAAPTQSTKEKSRSTSRDRNLKDKPKTKTAEAKKGTAKWSKSDSKKAKDKRVAGSEVTAAEIDNEREDLLTGKREIEGALELLQKELVNLRTNKKRLLESPSGAQRDQELENSIANERQLTDHMSQLKSAMAELNEHLEKLSSAKVWWLVDDVMN